jgi:hypothetical protein
MSIEDEINEEPEDSLPDASRGDLVLIEGVTRHFEEILGPIDIVFHEAKSRFVHVDVHRIAVEEGEDVCTLFTTGMAEKPMNVPSDVQEPDEYRYAELVLHLPADWPREWEDLKTAETWWPVGTLIQLARLPHERESWVWGGHTLLNGDGSILPYAGDVGFCAALVCPSYLLPDDAELVNLSDGRQVVLLTLAFIYLEEYEFCVEHGAEAFLDRVENFGLAPVDFFVLDKARPNVCA